MKLSRLIIRGISVLAILVPVAARALTVTVINTNDSSGGSLRQAVTDVNDGVDSSNTIGFSIPGSPPHTINLLSALPMISRQVLIDGFSQAGYSNGAPAVVIDGSSVGGYQHGIHLNAAGSVARGLEIRNWGGNGVLVAHDDCVVAGCHITASGNSGVLVGGVTGCTVGGTEESERNVLSGNFYAGVEIYGATASGNTVLGNYIGVDSTGLSVVSNGNYGLFVFDASSNTIGGASSGARNVISGRQISGILIQGMSASNNTILGNYIGTDATGMNALSNKWHGIHIDNTGNNAVGGSSAGEGNVISGNWKYGVRIEGTNATGNVVMGNMIGLAADGVTALGNRLAGVFVDSGRNNTIGGTSAGSGNFIAHNLDNGVAIWQSAATGNAILGNSIYNNGLLGIDLENDGSPEVNDFGDPDVGPNGLQNFPELELVTISGYTGITAFEGSLTSKSNEEYRIEFFVSSEGDTSDHGEGKHFIGWTSVSTDTSGKAAFNVGFDLCIAETHVVSATATDSENNTSEFSAYTNVSSFLDADSDDIEDGWENAHSLSYSSPNFGDTDGDGFSDLQEFHADTHPTNANEYPRITAISDGTTPSVSFPSSLARHYRLQVASELDGSTSWNHAGPCLPGNGGTMTLDMPPGDERGFCRVNAIMP